MALGSTGSRFHSLRECLAEKGQSREWTCPQSQHGQGNEGGSSSRSLCSSLPTHQLPFSPGQCLPAECWWGLRSAIEDAAHSSPAHSPLFELGDRPHVNQRKNSKKGVDKWASLLITQRPYTIMPAKHYLLPAIKRTGVIVCVLCFHFVVVCSAGTPTLGLEHARQALY